MSPARVESADLTARPQPVSRLEDSGFGSTLAGMAVAAVVHLASPLIREAGQIAHWLDKCVSVARAIASSARGFLV